MYHIYNTYTIKVLLSGYSQALRPLVLPSG